jgi:hypothetical protein
MQWYQVENTDGRAVNILCKVGNAHHLATMNGIRVKGISELDAVPLPPTPEVQ